MRTFILFLVTISVILSSQSYAGEDLCRNLKDHPAYIDEYRACIRTEIAIEAQRSGVDCVHCLVEQKNEPSDLVQALGVIAQPLGYLAAVAITARSQNQINERWARAYESGFEQCTNRFNSYLNYNSSVGANPITSSEAIALNNTCNGYGYGSYAGYGGLVNNGYGGFANPFLSMGYNPGFMGVYGGPYAMAPQSVYGNGMISGGMGVGGYAGFNFSAGASIGVTPTQGGVTTGFGF